MKSLLLILLALIAGFLGAQLASAKTTTVAKIDPVFERISTDRTLRCGYYYRTGYFEKDHITGQYKGLMHDVTMAIAQAADLKVEWVAEVGLGDAPEALRIGKIDAFCSAFGENTKRAWHTIVTEPVGYVLMNAYVKEGVTRFDNKPELMNDPAVTFNVVDGESTQFVTKAEFPKATLISVPQMTEHGDLLLGIAQGKADALLSDRAQAMRFNKLNPGKIREVITSRPIRSFPLGIGVYNTEPRLANLISAATRVLVLSGKMEKIIQANEEFPGTYGRNLLAR